ncbi:MAG: hypothetical protein ONB44_19030 [candidate division KSB1 bacterium]|nr:hypothetical protein [candidate division KSB1 bacterium]MDZ7304226.1 hypothetical protein [candidate division KSB1 bacterium]MDZ7311701.1 hypothetical protein [candidate division KSB1 bacterium]
MISTSVNATKIKFFAVVFLLLLSSVTFAQQSKNPDLSIIADFRTFTHNNAALANEKEKLNLNLDEIEMALQGYLNPYARADIFLAKHGTAGEVEIEEAYATFLRGLPLSLNIRAGKYLVDFGKLNTLHPHAYYFVERPLIHRLFFGDDGFNDTGINLSFLLPTGSVYSQVSLNVLKGDFVKGHQHAHGEAEQQAEEGETEKQALGYSGRLSSHFQVADYANLEFGISGATGVYDTHENLRLYLGGFDVKYRWVPSRYTSLTFQAEALLNQRDLIPGAHQEADSTGAAQESQKESVTTVGFFAYTNLQFRRRWNLGGIGEWTQAPDSKDEKYWAGAVFAGFAPMEETSVIRLLLRRERHPNEQAFNTALIQVIFSLGPHKAHVF